MTRLEKAILQVKEARLHENRPWIYNESGEIKEEAICGEALCLLEEMKDYEVSVDDDFVGELLSDINGVGDNTYNYNAKISNDLDYTVVKDKENGGYYFVCMVHLHGDIRAGYTDYFVCHFDYEGEWMELESVNQIKQIDKYILEINLFSEEYEVYDTEADEADEPIGYFYECDKEGLLERIKEKKS